MAAGTAVSAGGAGASAFAAYLSIVALLSVGFYTLLCRARRLLHPPTLVYAPSVPPI
jgi:hypothetical protein